MFVIWFLFTDSSDSHWDTLTSDLAFRSAIRWGKP